MQKNYSYISPKAIIHPSVKVGPFCYIGANVSISENCILKSHVSVTGNTKIGKITFSTPFVLLVLTLRI